VNVNVPVPLPDLLFLSETDVKKGKQTPKEEKEIIEQRLKRAEQIYKEEYGKKNKKN
jgi:hypothetical protein